MSRIAAGVLTLAVAVSQAGSDGAADRGAPTSPPGIEAPRFTSEGALLAPQGFREWMFLGASLGLSYSEHADTTGPGQFHNVYLHRDAYRHFRQSGAFPEGTVLVLELFQPASRALPARSGLFEGERVAVEAAVKDSSRFRGGWGYFSFGDGTAATAKAFPATSCADCHRAHAATDNVFTQFYPVLRSESKPTAPSGR